MNPTAAAQKVDAHIGARIAMRRAALGLTQEAVAKALNASARQVEAYEAGADRVTADHLFALAELLDVKLAYFFESENAGGRSATPGRLHELSRAV